MKTLKVTTLVLVIFSLTLGCSSGESSTVLRTKSFIVKPLSFSALSVTEAEGGILEVYGTISARIIFNDGSIKEERILWQRDRGSFINVQAEVLIDSDENDLLFRLNEDEIYSKLAAVEIVYSMYDYDPDGNDDFLGDGTLQFARFASIANRGGKLEERLEWIGEGNGPRNGILIMKCTIEQFI